VLAVSVGGAVMAADGEECSGDCLQQRLRTQDRLCSETSTRLQTRSRDRIGQTADEVAAALSTEPNQALTASGEKAPTNPEE
jgi:hypothetical protein